MSRGFSIVGIELTLLRSALTYRGRVRNLFFFIIRGANHANLYKKLIKIQIFNINLGAIGGRAGARPPVYAPAHIRACVTLRSMVVVVLVLS